MKKRGNQQFKMLFYAPKQRLILHKYCHYPGKMSMRKRCNCHKAKYFSQNCVLSIVKAFNAVGPTAKILKIVRWKFNIIFYNFSKPSSWEIPESISMLRIERFSTEGFTCNYLGSPSQSQISKNLGLSLLFLEF